VIAAPILVRLYQNLAVLTVKLTLDCPFADFENTQAPKQEAEIDNGQITYQSNNIPNWVQNTLTLLESRQSDRLLFAENTELPTTPANIDSGKYVGTVSQTTTNYIVQQTGDSLILHDRSIVKGEFKHQKLYSAANR
jgi:hypothetical protein